MAALFGITDLVCPGRNAFTLLEAPLLGLLAGWIASRLDLGRFTTCALAVVAMVALQWTSRGGLSALHLLVSFPFASTCAYLGYLREERGLD